MSDGGLGSETGGLRCLGAFVSAAEAAAASLPAAFDCWLWEVEVDALLHLEGTAAVRGGPEANSEAVQGRRAVEIYLLAQGQVQAVGVGYLVPAFVEPHWGGAGEEEEDAPWVRGIAAVRGRWGEGKMRMVLEVPWWACDVQQIPA